jgi:outer membrane protein assembly factor BamE (lipoprotein component of BamABCDE complex)
MIDDATRPIFRSKAAVKESEANRVSNQAIGVVSDQTEAAVGTLREGMTFRDVRDLLGEPNSKEDLPRSGKKDVARWTYVAARRTLLFEDGRLVSIAVR